MPYQPPSGYKVALTFVNGYEVPAGYKVGLEFAPRDDGGGTEQYLFPEGYDVSGAGHVAIRHAYRYVLPAAIPAPEIPSQHTAALKDRYLAPASINQTRYGRPTTTNVSLGIWPGGIAHPPQTGAQSQRQLPTPLIADRVRYLTPGGVPAPANQLPSTLTFTFDVQYIDVEGRGVDSLRFGAAKADLGNRTITALSIVSSVLGRPLVTRIQVVGPLGFSSEVVSDAHALDINLQRLLHHSGAADPAGYGDTFARNQHEDVGPVGWLDTEFQFPVVYNLRQEIHVSPYMGTNSDPTEWPNYAPYVENSKRVLSTGGWQSSRFSVIGNLIRNVAAPLRPAGMDATIWGADTFVSHRIRTVHTTGTDHFYSSGYTGIYNAADVLSPIGWISSAGGKPSQVLSLNRVIKHAYAYPGETVGTAFIADAIRNIRPNLFYDVPASFPEVRLNPFPIAPAGIQPPQFGGATVYEFFTIVAAKSTNVFTTPRAGEPIVANRNMTLTVFPSDQFAYGVPHISNYERGLLPSGGQPAEAYGRHYIGRRTLEIAASPASTPTFTVLHRIWNDLPDPPSRQLVEPLGIYIGVQLNPGVVPSPVIKLHTIFPESLSSTARLGFPVLTRNTIEIVRGIFDLNQVGSPWLSRDLRVFPRGIPFPLGSNGTSDMSWGTPRLSPHTVYAPQGDTATQQARRNHPLVSAHVIDHNMPHGGYSAGGGWPWFGLPGVTNQHREIIAYHVGSPPATSSRFGYAGLQLTLKYVYPVTIRSIRFGRVVFLNVPQYVDLRVRSRGIHPPEITDVHDVAPPFIPAPLTIAPQAQLFTLFGATRIELFNREVSPQGVPHRGNPQQQLTNPWGVPLVGFPREYVWTGGELTLWGNTWVSHKIRTFALDGWDSLTLPSETFGHFHDRMRVSRRNPEGSVAGIPSTAVFGAPDITFVNRAILARGIASYNSGEHRVKTFFSVTVDGWDSLEIGDIDRWEAGLVKAHGDDLSLVGYPRILNPLHTSGIFAEAVGAARFGSGIAPLDIPAIGFAGPSVSNPFGCTNRVVTPLPVLSQQNVPKPMVSQ